MADSNKKIRKKIRQYIDKWATPLGLGWWKVDVYYHYSKKAIRRYLKAPKGSTCLGRAYADWRYSEASVHFNAAAMAYRTDEENENTVIHELTHILVQEMREGDIDHEERVVTQLAKAFRWTREADKHD